VLIDRDAYFAQLGRVRAPVTVLTPILAVLFYRSDALFGLPGLMVGGWALAGHPAFSLAAALGTLLQAFHAWSWCLLLFSWAAKLLNRPSPVLTYLNGAVYPAYIAHQSLIHLAVFALGALGLDHALLHYALGPLLVALGAALVFEIVKRTAWTRVAFGIKVPRRQQSATGSRVRTAAFLGLTLGIIALLNFATWAYWVTSQ
jgi:hypothetical protein